MRCKIISYKYKLNLWENFRKVLIYVKKKILLGLVLEVTSQRKLDFFIIQVYVMERKVHTVVFSYSERWRYIGSVKPGNPFIKEGAYLSE